MINNSRRRPSPKALGDFSEFAEVIQFIVDNPKLTEPLKEIKDGIQEAQKEADRILQLKEENNALLATLATETAAHQQASEQAASEQRKARLALDAAEQRIRQANAAEADLAARSQEFNELTAKREREVSAREAAARDALAQGDALKQKYSKALAEIEAIANRSKVEA